VKGGGIELQSFLRDSRRCQPVITVCLTANQLLQAIIEYMATDETRACDHAMPKRCILSTWLYSGYNPTFLVIYFPSLPEDPENDTSLRTIIIHNTRLDDGIEGSVDRPRA
jgi:hypothetical protein